jgi:hypothetical protein
MGLKNKKIKLWQACLPIKYKIPRSIKYEFHGAANMCAFQCLLLKVLQGKKVHALTKSRVGIKKPTQKNPKKPT